VWGLAYKENTHSIKNSPSLATISQLPDTALQMHDPEVSPSVVNSPKARGFATELEAAKCADALMILTPWPQYRQIAAADIAAAMRGSIVLDPYAVLDSKSAKASGLSIHTLGRAPDGNRNLSITH
jgi:UDPglucose 6-dehydrogenase